jgi:pimeloyl-ACP methyl ester carboxylesterase
VEGRIGPGALFALYIPRVWNGDAVYYSHGVRDVGVDSPVDLRDQDSFFATRDLLGADGFAIAYSSWSDNGVAMKDGAQRVHQLRGIVAGELQGPPARSFLMSHSLGSGIALDLLQTYPTQYDGALLMCGMVGGTLLQSQYAGNVRALFDAFFPNYLPGDVLRIPEATPPATVAQVIAAVQSNPTALYAIASMAQTPLPYVPVGSPFDPTSTAFQTLVGSLFGPLSYQTRFANNLFELAHGHPTFDNSTTTYTLGASPLLPAAVLQPVVNSLNATVERYAFDPAGRNFMERHFTPTGDLRVPVLTLHNTWDPGVPAFHETALLAKVTAAGATANLLQRYYLAYGHCAIPAPVQAQNFLDMVAWVTTGTKPAS